MDTVQMYYQTEMKKAVYMTNHAVTWISRVVWLSHTEEQMLQEQMLPTVL